MSYSKAKKALSRFLSVTVSVTTTLWLLAPAFVGGFVPTAQAAEILDGAVITGPDKIDVFIVKLINGKMFKRLVLNPQVFDSYGHLKWENIQQVSQAVLDSYVTSDVVRVDGDTMVYRLIPDGDTGTKSWVMTAEVFLGLGYDWDMIYTINGVDGGNYTTGAPITSVTGEPPVVVPVGTGLTVTNVALNSLSVPRGATGIEMLKFMVSAGETATINTLKIMRRGIGSTNDFARVHLYENGARIGSSRTFSSESNAAEFSSLTLAFTAGQTRTFSILADFAVLSGAGNANYLELNTVTADKTVTGAPVAGPLFGIGAAAVGVLTVTNNGSLTNPRIGDTSAALANFSLTPATENAMLQRVTLRQTGSALLSNIANWGLYYAGTKIADGVVSGIYVSFMPSNQTVPDGTQRSFEVKGDITGSNRPNDTVQLSLENSSDLIATGGDFGINMFIDTNGDNTYTTNEYQDGLVTIQGGRLTFSFNGPTSSSIALNSQDVVVMEFTLTSTVGGYIDTLAVDVMADDDADNDPFDAVGDGADTEGLLNNGATEANFKDIKIRRKSSGVTAFGPTELTLTQTNANDASQTLTYNEDFTLTPGLSEVFQVTMDVDNNTPANIEFGARLNAITAYDMNNNTIAAADIVPTTLNTVRSNIMTTSAAALNVAMASTPTSQTVVGGGWVDSAGFVFTAGSSSPITVTSVTFTGFGDDDTVVAGATAAEFDDVVGQTRLMIGTTQLGTDESPSATGVFTFDGFSRTIPAGQSETWIVRALPDTTLLNSNADQFFVDLQSTAADTTTNVNAVDKDGNTVNATNNNTGVEWAGAAAQLNDDDATSVAVTVNTSGTLQVTLAGTPVESQMLLDGVTGNEVSRVRFDALNEPFNVNVLTVAIMGNLGTDTSGFDAVSDIGVYNGSTLVGGSLFSPDSNGRVRIANESTGLFTVTPGTPVTLSLKANVAAHGSNNQGTDAGDNIRLGVWASDFNSALNDFKAVGVNSSTSLTETENAADDAIAFSAGLTFTSNLNTDAAPGGDDVAIAGNNMVARAAKPVITVSGGTAGTLVSGNNSLVSFTINPNGGSTTFKRLVFNYTETDADADTNINSFVFKRGSTSLNSSVTITDQLGNDLEGVTENIASGEEVIVTFATEEEVTTATTYTLEATLSSGLDPDDDDSITVTLVNDVELADADRTTTAGGAYKSYAILMNAADLVFIDVNGDGDYDETLAAGADVLLIADGDTTNAIAAGDFTGFNIVMDAADQVFIDVDGDAVYTAATDITLVADGDAGNDTGALTSVTHNVLFTFADDQVFVDINANGAFNEANDILVIADGDTGNDNIVNITVVNSNFVWSDRSADVHTSASADFTDGFLVNSPDSDLDDVRRTLAS